MVALEYREKAYDILVSDDDEGCRESVRDALAINGYRPHVTSCGREAIEYARQHTVDVIIVDMNMPDLTGLETVRIIRSEISIVVPSVLMSADGSPELKLRARSAQFETFVPKPVDLSVLRHVIQDILHKYYEDRN